MTMLGILQTALLLGLYVALAGSYGFVYAMAHLWKASILRIASVILYGLHGFAAIAIVGWTPLEIGWKALIVASSVAFLAIPPITWRYLQGTHQTET
jgi:hypothetical protein